MCQVGSLHYRYYDVVRTESSFGEYILETVPGCGIHYWPEGLLIISP